MIATGLPPTTSLCRQSFKPLLLGFALILLYSAWALLVGDGENDEDLSDNAIVKFCSRVLPVSDRCATGLTGRPGVTLGAQCVRLVAAAHGGCPLRCAGQGPRRAGGWMLVGWVERRGS